MSDIISLSVYASIYLYVLYMYVRVCMICVCACLYVCITVFETEEKFIIEA